MQLPTNGPNQYLRILQYKHSSLICEITRADRGICQKSCDKNLRSDKFLLHRIFLYWHHHTYSPSRFHFLSRPELNFKANWAIIGWLDVWSSLQVPNSSADLASLCRFCGHQFFLADSHPLSLSSFSPRAEIPQLWCSTKVERKRSDRQVIRPPLLYAISKIRRRFCCSYNGWLIILLFCVAHFDRRWKISKRTHTTASERGARRFAALNLLFLSGGDKKKTRFSANRPFNLLSSACAH